MGAGTRTAQVEELLLRLSRAIGDGDRTRSRSLLSELAENVGEDDPEVTRLKTLLEFEEGEK